VIGKNEELRLISPGAILHFSPRNNPPALSLDAVRTHIWIANSAKEGTFMTNKVIMTVGLTTEPGKEAELSRWYRDVHIPEARPGMQGVSGVTLYESLKSDNNSPCILAIWEFDSPEAAKAIERAIENNQGGNFTPGPKCEIKLLSFFRQV
jgi:hypothetical protein